MQHAGLIIARSVVTVAAVFWEELKAEPGALARVPSTPTSRHVTLLFFFKPGSFLNTPQKRPPALPRKIARVLIG